MKILIPFTLSNEAKRKTQELIDEGWHFMLCYEPANNLIPNGEGMIWSADFTRPLRDGKWECYVSGIDVEDASTAIIKSYENIKNGKKLKYGNYED